MHAYYSQSEVLRAECFCNNTKVMGHRNSENAYLTYTGSGFGWVHLNLKCAHFPIVICNPPSLVHISSAVTSLCLQDFPGPVQADGRVLWHSEGLCGVRILPGQGHQPTGAGQHLLWTLEDYQQEPGTGQLSGGSRWRHPEGKKISL